MEEGIQNSDPVCFDLKTPVKDSSKIVSSPWFIIAVLLLVIVVVYALFKFKSSGDSSTMPLLSDEQATSEPTTVPNTPTLEPIAMPFDYKIVEISDTLLTLEGERGEMLLSINPTELEVWIGQVDQNPTKADFTALDVGKSASLIIIPNGKSWVYLEE